GAVRPGRHGPVPRRGRRGTRAGDRRCDRKGAWGELLRGERRCRNRVQSAVPGICVGRGRRLSAPSRPRRSQLTLSSARFRCASCPAATACAVRATCPPTGSSAGSYLSKFLASACCVISVSFGWTPSTKTTLAADLERTLGEA